MNLLLNQNQTIPGAGFDLRQGRRRAIDLVRECRDAIERLEPEVRAWVHLDLTAAEEAANQLDRELSEGRDRGPLHGIPIGVKDIIDVAGMPTGLGAPMLGGRSAAAGTELATVDAPLVAQLRAAGAVILGKTVTTPYAWIDPPVTRNPWNPERTPGGSSSGSAAAVSSGMCYAAIGSQTGGSILRPASYCGVSGFKPSYGAVSTTGVLPLAASLDHPGPIARSVADLEVVFSVIAEPAVLASSRTPAFSASKLQAPDSPEPDRATGSTPRVGWLQGFFDERAEPSMRTAIKGALTTLASAGATINEAAAPVDFDRVLQDHRALMAREAAVFHGPRLARSPELYPPRIRALVEEGEALPGSASRSALNQRADAIQAFRPTFKTFNVLATPAATGPAPDPSTTGDPAFNAPWSFLGFPTVGIPIGLSPEGLPLGLQLIGGPGSDFQLLRIAAWCEAAIQNSLRSKDF
jgi:aspartyl-tRNA(Asn)/glutamyl-tRNA(Gln) amidotransferase subunit A